MWCFTFSFLSYKIAVPKMGGKPPNGGILEEMYSRSDEFQFAEKCIFLIFILILSLSYFYANLSDFSSLP